METKIKKTISEWLPEATKGLKGEPTSDYQIMRSTSDYCLALLHSADDNEKAMEVFKIVNILYQEEHAYTRHCIENEFICTLIENSPALPLKQYLSNMPHPLREAFIKTLIEL